MPRRRGREAMLTPEVLGLQIRYVDSARSCPYCGGVVVDREMSMPVQRALEPAVWVLANRQCVAGCDLLGEERTLEVLEGG